SIWSGRRVPSRATVTRKWDMGVPFGGWDGGASRSARPGGGRSVGGAGAEADFVGDRVGGPGDVVRVLGALGGEEAEQLVEVPVGVRPGGLDGRVDHRFVLPGCGASAVALEARHLHRYSVAAQ